MITRLLFLNTVHLLTIWSSIPARPAVEEAQKETTTCVLGVGGFGLKRLQDRIKAEKRWKQRGQTLGKVAERCIMRPKQGDYRFLPSFIPLGSPIPLAVRAFRASNQLQ